MTLHSGLLTVLDANPDHQTNPHYAAFFFKVHGTYSFPFLMKLVSELIRLFINVAQDNERLVRLSEAAIGKPWAPK